MIDKELKETLDNILFQLHVISSQNFTALAQTMGEDVVSEKTREYAFNGLKREQAWMKGFLEKRGGEVCASGTYSSSDS